MDKGRVPSPHDDFLAALANVPAQSSRGLVGSELVTVPPKYVEVYDPQLPVVRPQNEIQIIPAQEGNRDRPDTRRLWLSVAIGSSVLGVVAGVGINNLSNDSTDAKPHAAVAAPIVHHKKPQPVSPTPSENAPLSNGVFLPNTVGTPGPNQPTLIQEAPVEHSKFKIGSINILGSNHEGHVAQRAKASVSTLIEHGVSVFGVQELHADQLSDFKQNLPTYASYPAEWTPQGSISERTIFWDNTRFKAVDGGKIRVPWYSATTPDELTAAMPWVKLEDNTTHQQFLVINDHEVARERGKALESHQLDVGGARKRAKEAEIIMADIAKLTADGTPAVLLGDMNSLDKIRLNGRVNDQAIQGKKERLPFSIFTKSGLLKHVVSNVEIDQMYVTPANISVLSAGYVRNGLRDSVSIKNAGTDHEEWINAEIELLNNPVAVQ
jgi:hypothetical protein